VHFSLQINPTLSQKIVIYNLREIIRLPELPLESPESPKVSPLDLVCYNNRLRSFNSKWELKSIAPQQLAESGFYYVGPGDRVRCLFCSIEIDHWEPTDDPMTEHRRISPLCVFFPENPGI